MRRPRNVTPLGCEIIVSDAPEDLRPGKMVTFKMRSRGDYRTIEVFMSPENIERMMEDLVE